MRLATALGGAAALGSAALLVHRRLLSSTAVRRLRSKVTFETLDVFSSARFGGNPLAVVLDKECCLSDQDMQRIAAEFGYSETTFVLPPRDCENTAWVRIFSPTSEMPFAGHPNVGTATVLAWHGEAFGRMVDGTVRLEEQAGIVPLEILRDADGTPVGAFLTAPEAFTITEPCLPVNTIAACLGLDSSDICTAHHPPLVGTTGLPFIVVELNDLDALQRSRGCPSPFAEARSAGKALATSPPKILAYVATDGAADADIRCRMHRADGTEDAGTGSANCVLMGLLASLSPPPAGATATVAKRIVQGVEMGRRSELLGEAERLREGECAACVGAVRIGGQCAPVSRGELVGW